MTNNSLGFIEYRHNIVLSGPDLAQRTFINKPGTSHLVPGGGYRTITRRKRNSLVAASWAGPVSRADFVVSSATLSKSGYFGTGT
jgi:hypothetical protein